MKLMTERSGVPWCKVRLLFDELPERHLLALFQSTIPLMATAEVLLYTVLKRGLLGQP